MADNYPFNKIINEFVGQKQTKEEYLKNLEIIYDNSSWDEIQELTDQVRNIPVQDEMIENILMYVQEKNRITFKQWKVLRLFVRNNSIDKRYKYGR